MQHLCVPKVKRACPRPPRELCLWVRIACPLPSFCEHKKEKNKKQKNRKKKKTIMGSEFFNFTIIKNKCKKKSRKIEYTPQQQQNHSQQHMHSHSPRAACLRCVSLKRALRASASFSAGKGSSKGLAPRPRALSRRSRMVCSGSYSTYS